MPFRMQGWTYPRCRVAPTLPGRSFRCDTKPDKSADSGRAPFVTNASPPRVLVLANQKGGVGKTTTTINLGTALAAIGERVLVIDIDPQGNASTGLGIDRKARKLSTFEVLAGECSLAEAIMPTAVPRLWLAPSTLDLLGIELHIANDKHR